MRPDLCAQNLATRLGIQVGSFTMLQPEKPGQARHQVLKQGPFGDYVAWHLAQMMGELIHNPAARLALADIFTVIDSGLLGVLSRLCTSKLPLKIHIYKDQMPSSYHTFPELIEIRISQNASLLWGKGTKDKQAIALVFFRE